MAAPKSAKTRASPWLSFMTKPGPFYVFQLYSAHDRRLLGAPGVEPRRRPGRGLAALAGTRDRPARAGAGLRRGGDRRGRRRLPRPLRPGPAPLGRAGNVDP